MKGNVPLVMLPWVGQMCSPMLRAGRSTPARRLMGPAASSMGNMGTVPVNQSEGAEDGGWREEEGQQGRLRDGQRRRVVVLVGCVVKRPTRGQVHGGLASERLVEERRVGVDEARGVGDHHPQHRPLRPTVLQADRIVHLGGDTGREGMRGRDEGGRRELDIYRLDKLQAA